MLVCRRVISFTSVSTGLSDNPSDEDFTHSSATGNVWSRRSKQLLSAVQSGSSKRVCSVVLSSDDNHGLEFSGVLGGSDEDRDFICWFSGGCPDLCWYYRLFSIQNPITQEGDVFDVLSHFSSESPRVSPLLHVEKSACGSKAKRGRTQHGRTGQICAAI